MTGGFQTNSISKAKNLLGNKIQAEKNIITTSTLDKWMVKVGTTSKSDVTKKRKNT